jgi:DNA repair exonuclease SbcCD ATPase subunit
MALSLSKAERAQHAALAEALSSSHERLSAAVESFNAALEAARAELAPLVEDWNEKLSEAREFASDIKGNAEGELEEKSERWQESDKGRQAAEWIEAWGWEPEDWEPEAAEELEPPSEEEAQGFADLPAKPGANDE